ncbi:Methyl-CpG-binding domain protein 4 [Paramyrothecium foliicola]|nr:Methyl-CpG-binding domain protein 4 [Paramyrothecium foliicola]
MDSLSFASMSRRITRSMRRDGASNPQDGRETTQPASHISISTMTKKSVIKQLPLPTYLKTISASRTPTIHAQRFGLIQEKVAYNLYQLLVAATLWNRTKGSQAKPVFVELVRRYPSPEDLARAAESELANLLRPLGLHNSRARRFVQFAQAWLECPPTQQRRYRKLHYPSPGSGKDVAPAEVLDPDDSREGWEIAHLPGVGPYALDSFRIFHRDILRGLATDWEGSGAASDFEPEWKRVVPLDKELKAYIRWMWLKDGWIWDPSSAEVFKGVYDSRGELIVFRVTAGFDSSRVQKNADIYPIMKPNATPSPLIQKSLLHLFFRQAFYSESSVLKASINIIL